MIAVVVGKQEFIDNAVQNSNTTDTVIKIVLLKLFYFLFQWEVLYEKVIVLLVVRVLVYNGSCLPCFFPVFT